jgi:hypothetical protein
MADKTIDVAVAGCQDALRESVRRLALDFQQRLGAAPHDQAKQECHDEFQVGLRRAIEAHKTTVELVVAALKPPKKSDKKDKKEKKKKEKKDKKDKKKKS